MGYPCQVQRRVAQTHKWTRVCMFSLLCTRHSAGYFTYIITLFFMKHRIRKHYSHFTAGETETWAMTPGLMHPSNSPVCVLLNKRTSVPTLRLLPTSSQVHGYPNSHFQATAWAQGRLQGMAQRRPLLFLSRETRLTFSQDPWQPLLANHCTPERAGLYMSEQIHTNTKFKK